MLWGSNEVMVEKIVDVENMIVTEVNTSRGRGRGRSRLLAEQEA